MADLEQLKRRWPENKLQKYSPKFQEQIAIHKKQTLNTKIFECAWMFSPELGTDAVVIGAILEVLESTTVWVWLPIDTGTPVDKIARVETLSVLLSVSRAPSPVDDVVSSVKVVIVSTLVVLLSVYVFKHGFVLVIWIANAGISV